MIDMGFPGDMLREYYTLLFVIVLVISENFLYNSIGVKKSRHYLFNNEGGCSHGKMSSYPE
jgi:hypothetical protein